MDHHQDGTVPFCVAIAMRFITVGENQLIIRCGLKKTLQHLAQMARVCQLLPPFSL
jgi:hypothetical protein